MAASRAAMASLYRRSISVCRSLNSWHWRFISLYCSAIVSAAFSLLALRLANSSCNTLSVALSILESNSSSSNSKCGSFSATFGEEVGMVQHQRPVQFSWMFSPLDFLTVFRQTLNESTRMLTLDLANNTESNIRQKIKRQLRI